METSRETLSKQKITSILKKLKLNKNLLLRKLLNRVWLSSDITPHCDEPCWFINEDWSVYTSYNRQSGHRYIFKTFYPRIVITKLLICHKCDRPGCINPAHLFVGTAKDNFHDSIDKGRMRRSRINYRVNSTELERARELDNWRNKTFIPIDEE